MYNIRRSAANETVT